jgi:hypothetical protein
MDDDLINFKQVYGVSASNLFLYEYENKFANNYKKIHQLTYDYFYNSIYVQFYNESWNNISLIPNIGEILNYDNKTKKWNLDFIDNEYKLNVFKKLIEITIKGQIKNMNNFNIPEERLKLNQMLYLLK